MRRTFRKQFANGWATRWATGKETPPSLTRRTSQTRHDSEERPRTCMSSSDSRASPRMRCCIALPSKIRQLGRGHGRVSTRGRQRTNLFMNTPATKIIMRWRTYCVERGGGKPMKRLRKAKNDFLRRSAGETAPLKSLRRHDVKTSIHHDYHRRYALAGGYCSRPRPSCLRKRVRPESPGAVEGQSGEGRVGEPPCLDPHGSHEFRRHERCLDDRGWKSQFPASAGSDEGVPQSRHRDCGRRISS